ncbi:MAG: S41 family peptidase [Acholeplasmataceae bacterium]
MKKNIILAMFLFLSLLLVSCVSDEEITTYEITFNSNGGTQIASQSIEESALVTEPENPVKPSSVFRYWYIDDKDIPYDFTDVVTSDFKLNAFYGSADVIISTSETFNFSNETTEFDVADNTLDLYYTNGGSVPYVKVRDFFDLLVGFIDPETEFTFTEDETGLEIFYQYYDEDEDETYDLTCNFDLTTNLITTNDPGFYWAYIYSTETNYGRNIEYLYDYELNETIEGTDVIYNLNTYSLDLAYYDGSIVAPYYLVNQLFAGSSYYNVYFNGESLYGVYGQISSADGLVYMKMKRTSVNGESVPSDLLNHSYNMLAFDLDYFYGLKDFKDISTFYNVLSTYKSKLLSSDYEVVSQAITDLLLKTIDEPHTSYGFPGYYAETSYAPSTGSLADYGERFNDWYMNGLFAVDEVIADKWNVSSAASGWAADSSSRPNYWYIDDNSAVITFDSFTTADIEETDVWFDDAYKAVFDETSILPAADGGNRYFVYNQSTDKDDITETLIWGLNSDFASTYGQTLVSDGWTLITDSAAYPDYHLKGYYSKTINDVNYMVTLNYNSKYSTAYIGVTNELPTDFDDSWSLTADVVTLIESDSAVYLETMIKEIKDEKPDIANIGLDLTFNTGGNVGALYRILGLMTSEPFGTSNFSRDTYSYSTTYITTSYDSYDEYNWFLLTSYVSFSAANELITIFKQNEVGVIIGQASGGGACSITPILLPDGTFFTMSSNSVNCYKDADGNYVFNELGIEPDYTIDQEDLFDSEVLADILNN